MLTLQFVSFGEIASLNPDEKLKKLLDFAKDEKIILLEGKLKSNEKSDLIAKTMSEISPTFKGIEIEELDLEAKNLAGVEKLKSIFVNMLLGDRKGFTIIGPANIIKEIKRDPDKIQLLTLDFSKKKRR